MRRGRADNRFQRQKTRAIEIGFKVKDNIMCSKDLGDAIRATNPSRDLLNYIIYGIFNKEGYVEYK